MVHKLLKSHLSIVIFYNESIPEGPVFAQKVGCGSLDGVGEGHEWQGQVGKPVLEEFDLKWQKLVKMIQVKNSTFFLKIFINNDLGILKKQNLPICVLARVCIAQDQQGRPPDWL